MLLDRKVRTWPINSHSRAALGEAKASPKDPEASAQIIAMLKLAGAREGDPVRPVDQELLAAAARGDLAGVKSALARGADVDARGKMVLGKPWLPDPLAAALRYPAVVRYLLEKGSDPHKTWGAGNLFNYAAADGVPETIELLASLGLGPADASRDKVTPLFVAINAKKPSAANVATLLKLGADPSAPAPGGFTLVEQARMRKLTKIVALLEAAIQARQASPDAAPAAP